MQHHFRIGYEISERCFIYNNSCSISNGYRFSGKIVKGEFDVKKLPFVYFTQQIYN